MRRRGTDAAISTHLIPWRSFVQDMSAARDMSTLVVVDISSNACLNGLADAREERRGRAISGAHSGLISAREP